MKFKKTHQGIVKLKLMNIILVVDFQLIEWEDESYRDIEVASIPNTALSTLPVLIPLYLYHHLYLYLYLYYHPTHTFRVHVPIGQIDATMVK